MEEDQITAKLLAMKISNWESIPIATPCNALMTTMVVLMMATKYTSSGVILLGGL